MFNLFYYATIKENCSCRDENNEPTKIGIRYKEFYNLLLENPDKNGAEILTEMNIFRSCCRIRFLSIPNIPMIDRVNNKTQINDVDIPLGDIVIDKEIKNFP